ncbi:hypothetical protein DQ04_01391100 [Trypanosoma grayi]|uniref:hypothetical protein n=1 Tax=Trypanosoma grayi TaxID=71804 RepID=UPI0004F4BA02|nr:hypothetical protein DQ04_01391100 [Trypanosoma grayi]KEG12842.1 hypothetical protein DQ04_01391100 [Trypanosoma grayi]
MCESVLHLRRRCLFLFDSNGVGAALQHPGVATRAASTLIRAQELLGAPLHHWMQQHQFSDWQECVECLLYHVEQQQQQREGAAGAVAATAVETVCREVLQELTSMFASEAQAYDAAAASFSEDYWRRVQKPRRQLHASETDAKAVVDGGDTAGARVSWSIAAEVSPLVEQVFLLP